MPRKGRVEKGSRAERWLRDWESGDTLPGIDGLDRLLKKGPCAVDEPLAEAIRNGMLTGDVDAHREQLFFLAVDASSTAAATYLLEAARPALLERRERAVRLAAELREFCRELSKVAEDAEEASEAAGTADDVAIERSVVSSGEVAASALDALAAIPVPSGRPPAVDVEGRAFRDAIDRWWGATAIDPDRRGAKVLRDAIADALREDMVLGEGTE